MDFYSNKKIELGKISNLFEKSFNQNFDKEYWEWRFLSNPNSQETLISYIEEDNILLAYYAVTPMKIEIKGKGTFKVALSNMTMTHPEHQGKGYFKKLAKALYSELDGKGYIGVYGFANQNSHYGFRKYLNWQDLSVLNNFGVNNGDFRSFLLSSTKKPEISTSELSIDCLKKINSFSFTEKPVLISRDFKNLKWRFYDNPSNQYYSLNIKVESTELIVIYKKYMNSVDVMEVFYNSDNEELKYFSLMKGFEYLFKNGFERINIWSNLYSFEHLILEKFGFKKEGFSTYFGFIPLKDKFEELLDVKNWHFRFTDSDVY
jgi:GNAT superfamily N-acetyltransferase